MSSKLIAFVALQILVTGLYGSDPLTEAFTFLATGDPELALRELEIAVEANPDSPDAWYLMGEALALLGRHEDSEKAFEAALRIRREGFSADPSDGHQLYQQAFILLLLGRESNALVSFRKWKRDFPNDPSSGMSEATFLESRSHRLEERNSQQPASGDPDEPGA